MKDNTGKTLQKFIKQVRFLEKNLDGALRKPSKVIKEIVKFELYKL